MMCNRYCERRRNRILAGRMTEAIVLPVHTHISWLQDDFKTTEREIKAHLKAHPKLKAFWQCLQTIPGLGGCLPHAGLPHLGEIARFHKVDSLVSAFRPAG